MGRRLERCAGCLLNLDPGQKAPSRCMQGSLDFGESMELCVWHRSVEYAAGAIGKAQLHYYDIMRHIELLQYFHKIYHVDYPPFTSYLSSSFYPLRSPQTDHDRPCALDMCNTARSFTHRSNTCVIRRLAFLILGFIEQMSCRSLPPSQPGIAEFWYVHDLTPAEDPKSSDIFWRAFFWRGITAREQLSRAVILARF